MLSFDLLEIFSSSFFMSFIDMPISEKSSKIKFLEKFQKILYNFYVKNRAERHLGGTRWGSHATSHTGGTAQPWPRHPGVRGPTRPLTHLFFPCFFSLLKNTAPFAQARVLAVLHLEFSISSFSPTFLLKLGSFALRYVTPPLVQVDFLLVEYFLSILAL
jgi:hypothetical protein